MLYKTSLIIFLSVLGLSQATRVFHCDKGGVYNDTNQVKISNCDNTLPCVLKKQTTATIEQRFSPTHDVKKLYKNVLAKIDLITLPFFGVDGTDACGEIFNLDGSKAGCPLVKDQEYIYRNQFDILQLYPTLSMVVHWALVDENKKIITCFEVPAQIKK